MSLTDPDIDELQRERARLGLDPSTAWEVDPRDEEDGVGTSIADRVSSANGAHYPELEGEEEDPEELFVLQQGRKVPISRLIRQGTPVEYMVNLNARSIKGASDMGLLPYGDPEITLVVSARQGKVVIDPTFTDDGYVEKVTVRVNLKPQTVCEVTSPTGRALLGLD